MEVGIVFTITLDLVENLTTKVSVDSCFPCNNDILNKIQNLCWLYMITDTLDKSRVLHEVFTDNTVSEQEEKHVLELQSAVKGMALRNRFSKSHYPDQYNKIYKICFDLDDVPSLDFSRKFAQNLVDSYSSDPETLKDFLKRAEILR